LGDLNGYASAVRFARRHGVSPLAYPAGRAANIDMLPAWIDPPAGLVLDIGANEGDWTAAVLRVFPEAEVIAAEPGSEPRAVLARRFAGSENVRIDLRAVSDLRGTASFYRTRASVFSSLHRPQPALHELYALPGGPTTLIETVTVETVTLDDLAGDRAVSVLKLDVQGGELAVLRSGRRVLENTAAVLIEVLFLPHYEGDATFPDLHSAMTEIGFALIDLSAPFRLDGGPALWADACYARLPRA
jgi:FkbM family methyltransferase